MWLCGLLNLPVSVCHTHTHTHTHNQGGSDQGCRQDHGDHPVVWSGGHTVETWPHFWSWCDPEIRGRRLWLPG